MHKTTGIACKRKDTLLQYFFRLFHETQFNACLITFNLIT